VRFLPNSTKYFIPHLRGLEPREFEGKTSPCL